MAISVLIVDDEPSVVSLFKQYFRRETRTGAIKLEFAESGEAALGKLESLDQPPMLVLSDINMPGMTGLDLLNQVRERWPALAVIMVTAYGDPATRAQAQEMGARDLLEKPVDFDVLKRRIAGLAEA